MAATAQIHVMNVLIVDSADSGSNLLKAVLKQEGFENVFTTRCLDQAMEVLQNNSVDLILLSYVLPKISGAEACKQISTNPLYEDIPIIMVTANNDIETLQTSFEHGAIDYIAKPFNGQELIARVQAHLIRKSISDKRKKIALTDPLTEAYNRRHFDMVYDSLYTRSIREKKVLTFIMIDIDNFKKYNDNYGHQKGDIALKEVARTLKEQLESLEDLEGDLFRLGGEEFAILLYDVPLGRVEVLSTEIHKALGFLKIEHAYNENFGYLTISVGIAQVQCAPEISKFTIYNSADQALYQSKKNGRNQTSFTQVN